MKRLISIAGSFCGTLAVVFFALFLNLAPVQAKTTVTPSADYCSYTITVEIAFVFLDAGSQAKADDLIKTWTDAMNSFWNGPTGSQTFGECGCKATFEFKVLKLTKGQACPAGYHCMNVVDQPSNQRGNVADAYTVPPDGSMNSGGEWTTGAKAADAAHEAGHMMGLDEEYHYEDKDGDGKKETYVNDNPQKNPDGSPKDPQSIMAQTWGVTAVLPEHVEEIVNDGGYICPGTCCCGNGKVDNNKSAKEECDPKAKPCGCPASDQECTDQCMCIGGVTIPPCGNGTIDAGEQCDPGATPKGCKENESCVECKCVGAPTTGGGTSGGGAAPVDGGGASGGETTPSDGGGTEGGGVGSGGGAIVTCGNAACETGETCTLCPLDCDACPAVCGNGVCDADETCLTCAGDCETCPPVCGDGLCDLDTENCTSCGADCGACAAACGDGACDGGETCSTCVSDCGACFSVCGNGVCESGESCSFCPIDCWACGYVCSDGKDNDGDLLIDYPEDPGCIADFDEDESNLGSCGDGICQPELGELPVICPTDCI